MYITQRFEPVFWCLIWQDSGQLCVFAVAPLLPQKLDMSNDIFACVTLSFAKRKCYIWTLLIAPPAQAMCHTYDSHLGESINLLCRGKRTQLFTKSYQNAAISSSCRGIFGNLSNLARKKKGPDAIPLYIYSISIDIERSFQCIDIFVAYFWTDWKCTFDASGNAS